MDKKEEVLRQARSMNVTSEKTLEILVKAAEKAKHSSAALDLESRVDDIKGHFENKRTFFMSLKKGNRSPEVLETLEKYIQDDRDREKEVLRHFDE